MSWFTKTVQKRKYSYETSKEEIKNVEVPNVPKIAGTAIGSVLLLSAVASALYTIDEGNVGIVKRFGEAINQVDPGLHIKAPFIDNIVSMDVRTRKYQLLMSASTTGRNKDTGHVELQVPSKVLISANWSVPKANALEIYKEYGGLEQYEDKILDPRVLKTTKATIAKYSIEDVISNRETVTSDLVSKLTDSLTGFQAKMTDVNLEDVAFPPKVKKSIEDKQVAKQNFQTEEYTLQQQNLKAQRSVNTAKAEAESVELRANAKANAIIAVGNAEAKAIKVKSEALKANPAIIQLTVAENWNGILPTHMLGENTSMLLTPKEILK